MSLRTRLIIAFVLLSVVPLSLVTWFTYASWVETFEAAAQREAAQSAADIGRRMERITADIGRRMDRMFVGPLPAGMRERVAPTLGAVAALVDRVEFHPAPPGTHSPAAAPAPHPTAPPAAVGPPPPPPPPAARGGRRGRPRAGALVDVAPAPVPEVIVVDVQEALAAAKELANAEVAARMPELGPLIAESLDPPLPAASAAAKPPSPAQPAPPDVQMQVEGRRVQVAVKQDGKLLGTANAMLNLDRALRTVFAFARTDQGEIPFAIDTRGTVHNPDPAQMKALQSFGVAALGRAAADGRPRRAGDWLIVARKDPSGLIFGIARPMGESLREIRRASWRNLSLGLIVIALALVGIVPIAHGMTRHLVTLNAGVRQLAKGDFGARVPVRGADEFASLAAAFNQMAEDLERHQALRIEQERLRRELELSRLIQTEMLPRAPLRLGAAEIKGVSVPAREVGGDFFNYFALGDGRLGLLVGDVSGKGVSAALLMANVQATLRARLARDVKLADLAAHLDVEIDAATPGPMYLTLFVGVLDPERHELRYVNAGHNPQFIVRAGGGIEQMIATGLPLALLPGKAYTEAAIQLNDGDMLFFYTDGVVEAENEAGEPFGLERLKTLLTEASERGIDDVLQRVDEAVRTFRGAVEPQDDATMMALRLNR